MPRAQKIVKKSKKKHINGLNVSSEETDRVRADFQKGVLNHSKGAEPALTGEEAVILKNKIRKVVNLSSEEIGNTPNPNIPTKYGWEMKWCSPSNSRETKSENPDNQSKNSASRANDPEVYTQFFQQRRRLGDLVTGLEDAITFSDLIKIMWGRLKRRSQALIALTIVIIAGIIGFMWFYI
tara:strand:- start:6097 stop:6639 length:543 start_codon:yes stop_codon:yes gene_type:complete